MMSNGDSNAEIGAAISVKPGTPKVHCTAIFKALGARNRVQAIDTYWRALGSPKGIEGAMSRNAKLRAMVAATG